MSRARHTEREKALALLGEVRLLVIGARTAPEAAQADGWREATDAVSRLHFQMIAAVRELLGQRDCPFPISGEMKSK